MIRAADPKRPTTVEIRDLVRSDCLRECNRFGPAFFAQHVDVVAQYGRRLADRLHADAEVVELASYLHDLAAVRDFGCAARHHVESAALARELLVERGWAPRVVDAVCRCIATHTAPVAPGRGTPEEVCLSNADVLSHIARPAYWYFYLYGLQGAQWAEGVAWMRGRLEHRWSDLSEEARELVAAEREAGLRLLR